MAIKRSKQTVDGGKLNLTMETAGDYGDKRRQDRAGLVAERWAEHGAASFPTMLGEAGAEALYRLINNDEFSYLEVVAAHAAQAVARAAAGRGVVVAAHDTTGIEVPLHDPADVREFFAVKSSRTQGFELHVSSLFAFDANNTPLGVVALQPFVHAKHVRDNEAAQDYWWGLGGLYANEQARWIEAVERTAQRLGDHAAACVHVMDREADDYATLCYMLHHHHRVVQRAHTSRRFIGDKRIAAARYLQAAPVLARATVTLGARTPARSAKDKKTHPARKARVAHLTIRAAQVKVLMPKNEAAGRTIHGTTTPLPPFIEIGLVDVREEHPPKGEAGVHWLLLTSEPVTTGEEALTVVDLYRARWGTEVYFKVLKTGLGIETRQMESADSMLRVIALALPVAVHVLRLRHMADVIPGALWSQVLTPAQFAVLKHKCPQARLTDKATVDQVLLAVATLGGFLKSNKVPGWKNIYQGWERMETLAEGFEIARGF